MTPSPVARRVALVLGVTALHAAIASAAISPAFFYLNVGTAQRVFGGSNGERALLEDVSAYHDYASRTLRGSVPYRDFLVEYPIGALPLVLLPRLVTAKFEAFRWLFAAEMIAIDGLLVALVARRAERAGPLRRALTWYTLGLAALGALPIARFDLAPTALAFAAALSWEAGRARRGGTLAALGGLTKVFPIVVAGPGVLADGRRRAGGLAALVITLGLGVILWLGVGAGGVGRSLRYHAERGLEIESLYAGLSILAARVLGAPLSHEFNHSSVTLIVPWASTLSAIVPVVQIVAVGIALAAFKAGGLRDRMRYSGACVLAFALFGKVLSPQYLLWIAPFIAVLEGRAGRWARPTFVVCGVLTSLVYFWAGVGLVGFHPLAVILLNVRNAALVALFVMVVGLRDRGEPQAWVTPDPPA